MVEEGSKLRLQKEVLGSAFDKMRAAKFHRYVSCSLIATSLPVLWNAINAIPTIRRVIQVFIQHSSHFFLHLDLIFEFAAKPPFNDQRSLREIVHRVNFKIWISGLRIHSSHSPFQLGLGDVEIA
jgi:hypothetical protein